MCLCWISAIIFFILPRLAPQPQREEPYPFSSASPTWGPQQLEAGQPAGGLLMLGVWVGEGGQGMCFEYWTRRWHLQSQPCCFLHTSAIRTSSKPIKNQTNSMNIQWPRILIIVMNINGIGLALSTFSPVLFLPCSLSLFFHLAGSKDGS